MIKDELIKLAVENLDIDEEDVDLEKSISDLDIDSIDMLDFIMTIEEEYNIEFSDDELDKIEKLGDILDLIESKK
jgi:acyl carrier protein